MEQCDVPIGTGRKRIPNVSILVLRYRYTVLVLTNIFRKNNARFVFLDPQKPPDTSFRPNPLTKTEMSNFRSFEL